MVRKAAFLINRLAATFRTKERSMFGQRERPFESGVLLTGSTARHSQTQRRRSEREFK